MKKVSDITEKKYGQHPEKILQFGEGNFLRGFADWMIDNANENGDYKGSIVVCQPVEQGLTNLLNNQNSIYTSVMRGLENGEPTEKIRQITSISRCINPYADYEDLTALAESEDLEVVISNTTEAGIAYKDGDKLTDMPPASFPAKITAFLYKRYEAFDGAADKGLLFLPVELIDNNGDNLKAIVLRYAKEWQLEDNFIQWIETANKFTNTLVDRIVTGYPRDQISYFEEKLGYKDQAIVTSELFNLWVIEGKQEWKDILPIHKNEANVLWTDDVTPYKKRKVRILNGAHTSTVLAAYLAGHETVLDFMKDDAFKTYLEKLIFEEIIPTITLPKDELESFAAAVLERFSNPYIHHKLLDISLNSCSKFNARCLPSLVDYVEANKQVPDRMSFALAAFIKFYQVKSDNNGFTGSRADGTTYTVKDDMEVLTFFEKLWSSSDAKKIAQAVLSNKAFWSGQDLTAIPDLTEKVAYHLGNLNTKSVHEALALIAE